MDLINDYFKNISKGSKIFVDDFKCTLQPLLDRNSGSEYIRGIHNKVADIAKTFNLIDIWRETHGNLKESTWQRNESWARLDRFYISSDLKIRPPITVIYKDIIKGDHKIVKLEIPTKIEGNYGRLRGRNLPLDFLYDPEMQFQIKEIF